MVLTLAQSAPAQSLDRKVERFLPDVCEVLAFCPGCKTLETLWFNNGGLRQTRKFKQQGSQVFHDCGRPGPCRLYRTY